MGAVTTLRQVSAYRQAGSTGGVNTAITEVVTGMSTWLGAGFTASTVGAWSAGRGWKLAG